MSDRRPATGDWKSNMKSSLVHLFAWSVAWLVTMALATFGPEFWWNSKWLTLLAFLINLSCGVGMIVANIRHLKVLDEMTQKVQLEAMGLALGVGLVGGLSYSLLDTTNLIASDAEISHVVLLIGITYIVSCVVGIRKYL